MSNKLQKNVGLPVLDIGLDEPVLTDAEATEALRQESGMLDLSNDSVRRLARLGIYMRGVGVLRKQRGEVMVTQALLASTLQVLMQRLTAENARGAKARLTHIRGLAHEISVVLSVKNDSQHLALDLEKAAAPTGKPDEIERPRNTGFGTGTVIAAQEVHVHETKKELPVNGNGG